MFLVGADDASLRWLRHHGRYLRHRGAIGYVVGATSHHALQRLRDSSGIEALFPIAGAASIATTFEIDRYPVLIDPAEGRIVQ